MSRLLVCSMAFVFACGPMAEDEVVETTESLNGDFTFVDCELKEEEKLTDAKEHILAQLGQGGLFHDCLEDAQLTWTRDKTPEAIERALRQNMPTSIRCVPDSFCSHNGINGVACAGPQPTSERISVERAHIARAGIAELGGTIVHEIMHAKGWDHPDSRGTSHSPDYSFTVPCQVGQCMGFPNGFVGEPYGLARSALLFETELPPVGGGGGLPFELACASCGVARGFRVESSSSRVNKVAMHCDGLTTQSTGTTNDSTSTTDLRCPGDDVVVGLMSGSGGGVNGLRALCARRSTVRAGGTGWSQQPFLGGTISGEIITRTCPPTMAVKRIYGRSGTRIDQIRIVCEVLDAPPQGMPHALPIAGRPIGATQRNHCLGNGVMFALTGGTRTEIESLGGQCSPTWDLPNGDVHTRVSGFADEFQSMPIAGGLGTDQTRPFWDYCPLHDAGDALIGIQISAGARVDSVQGICANATAWSRPTGAVDIKYMRRRGGSGGDSHTRQCPRGEFIVGMQTWVSNHPQLGTPTVFGVQPICRRLDYPRPDLPVPACGGVVAPGVSTGNPPPVVTQ